MGVTKEKSPTYTGFEIDQHDEGVRVSQDIFAKDKIEVFNVKPERVRNPNS